MTASAGLGSPKSPALGSSLPDCVSAVAGRPPAQLPPAPSVVTGRELIHPLGAEGPRQLEKWRSRRLRTPGLPVLTGTQRLRASASLSGQWAEVAGASPPLSEMV